MKIPNKIKPLLGVAIIVGVAVIADLTYDAVRVQAGEDFNLVLSGKLFRLRPFYLAVVYTILLMIGNSLIGWDYSNYFNSLLLMAVGVAVLCMLTFIPRYHSLITRDLYNQVVILASTQLGITLHSGAILVALGGYRLIRFRLYNSPKDTEWVP
ncbi:MAG: hypothetical protein OEZ02_05250 [Anaerolineae bacterium]|nr:hypothetical protein [Anaerolineae bacterium]